MSEGKLQDNLKCPYCGNSINGYLSVDEKQAALPTDGDASICIMCRNLGIYEWNDHDKVFTVRKPTPEEVEELKKDYPNLFPGVEKKRQEKYN